jgi:hypothetical protein
VGIEGRGAERALLLLFLRRWRCLDRRRRSGDAEAKAEPQTEAVVAAVLLQTPANHHLSCFELGLSSPGKENRRVSFQRRRLTLRCCVAMRRKGRHGVTFKEQEREHGEVNHV